MNISNRAYVIAVIVIILSMILVGIWVYKSLKAFTDGVVNHKEEEVVGGKIETITKKTEEEVSSSTNEIYENSTNKAITINNKIINTQADAIIY